MEHAYKQSIAIEGFGPAFLAELANVWNMTASGFALQQLVQVPARTAVVPAYTNMISNAAGIKEQVSELFKAENKNRKIEALEKQVRDLSVQRQNPFP